MNKETKKRTTQREMMIVISKDTNQRETRTKTKQRPISQMTKSNTRELPRRKRPSHVTTRARFRKTLIVIEWNLLIRYILCLSIRDNSSFRCVYYIYLFIYVRIYIFIRIFISYFSFSENMFTCFLLDWIHSDIYFLSVN